MEQAPEAIARVDSIDGLKLDGVHAHIGSQLLGLEPFRREVAELAKLGDFPVWDLGGGLGRSLHRGSARAPGDRRVRL